MATVTKSPALTSISPSSFLNSSIGMKLSDLSPALTTTMLKSTRTTSAVMSSPWRISPRARDSLEQGGEAFHRGRGVAVLSMLGVAVAMGVGSFSVSAAGGENPFSRTAGWLTNPSGRRLKRRPDGLLLTRRLRACVREWPRRDSTVPRYRRTPTRRWPGTGRARRRSAASIERSVVSRIAASAAALSGRRRPRGIARVALLEFAQKTFNV